VLSKPSFCTLTKYVNMNEKYDRWCRSLASFEMCAKVVGEATRLKTELSYDE